MAVGTVCWEDEENNRRVDMRVEFDLAEGQLQVHCVTPNAVTFVDSESGEVTRRIGVHTDAGRQILVRQFMASGGMNQMEGELTNELVAAG